MTDLNAHNSRPPENLPGSLEPELKRLDARLTRDAGHLDLPPGLADRVFEASVGRLPAQRYRFQTVETISTSRRLVLRRQVWARVALAASLAVAFVMSAQILMKTSSPVEPDVFAGITEPLEILIPEMSPVSDDRFVVLQRDAEQLLFALAAGGMDDFSYMAMTREITLDDLNDEFAALSDVMAGEGM